MLKGNTVIQKKKNKYFQQSSNKRVRGQNKGRYKC